MDEIKKAAIIAVNRMWEVATDLETILTKYNQYMALINSGDEEGKILLTQLLKDIPKWLKRNIDTLSEAGRDVSEFHDIKYKPLKNS